MYAMTVLTRSGCSGRSGCRFFHVVHVVVMVMRVHVTVIVMRIHVAVMVMRVHVAVMVMSWK